MIYYEFILSKEVFQTLVFTPELLELACKRRDVVLISHRLSRTDSAAIVMIVPGGNTGATSVTRGAHVTAY